MFDKANMYNKFGQVLRSLGIKVSKLPGSKYLLRVMAVIIGDLAIEVDGLRLTGSFWHRRELWKMREGRYEKFTVELFKQSLSPGMVVCDIGAHIGFYALLAAQKVGPHGRVYAFEPDPRTFPYLVYNIEQNGFSNIIIPIKKAVSNHEGILRLHLDEITSGDTSLFHRNTSGRTVEVQSVKLDDFLEGEAKVDIVKLDIEGGELAALEGMESLLKRSNNVTMFVECNPSMLEVAGSNVEQLLEKLYALGFEVKVINDKFGKLEMADPEKILSMARHSRTPTWSINLYCVRGG